MYLILREIDSEYWREVEMVEDEQHYIPALIQNLISSKFVCDLHSWEDRE